MSAEDGPVLPADIEEMQRRVAESLWHTLEGRVGEQSDDIKRAFLDIVTPFVATRDLFVTSHEIREDLRQIRERLAEREVEPLKVFAELSESMYRIAAEMKQRSE